MESSVGRKDYETAVTLPSFQKTFLIRHALPYTATRVPTHRRGFAFNDLLTCGDCGCKVLGEEKKKRFVYYHCAFSKGRHNGWGYVPEREIARFSEPAVKAVTFDEEVVDFMTLNSTETQLTKKS